jgi:ribosome biogenesis GTPase
MRFPALGPYGWNDRWEALLTDHPGCRPARVVRHDGVGLLLATPDGVVASLFSRRLDPAPTVGDWLATDADDPVAVLPRTSLLRRRSSGSDTEQVLAANIDVVLLVCGADRPLRPGRIHRGTAVAHDAGARPVVVLTKAAVVGDAEAMATQVEEWSPGLEVLVTSALEGVGLDAVRALVRNHTVTMLGESGAGKSSLVNALIGEGTAATADVRAGDAKGRHTTTTRELHVVPTGGVLIDSPGIRSVGVWTDPDAVDATFADVDSLALECRFTNCRHDTEPGCAVAEAVVAGTLDPERLGTWRVLQREAEGAALRAAPDEQRRRDKQFGNGP